MKLNKDKVNAYIEKMMFYHDIPGLAVGIGKNGDLIYKEGFGYKNIKTKEKVEEDTIFHMASLTKLFVGTSIMQLMEKGLIDIEEPVKKYISYFKINDPAYEHITIQQMLSHTSGIPQCEEYEWDKPQYDETALEVYVKSKKDVRLLSKPGEKFNYSDIAYEILGDVISKVSGMSFEEYVDKNIFKPLNMDNSSLLTFKRNYEEIASPHVKNEKKQVILSPVFPYNRVHAPSSTLTSNVKDIFIWANVNLNKGTYKNTRILKEETYNLMWKSRVKINSKESVGISWFYRKHKELELYGHEGSDTGFRSSFAIIPEQNMHISIHANSQSAPTKRIQKGILDTFLGDEPEIK